jgi:hypothetical protein
MFGSILSGRGDTCRRNDATGDEEAGNIPALGWTLPLRWRYAGFSREHRLIGAHAVTFDRARATRKWPAAHGFQLLPHQGDYRLHNTRAAFKGFVAAITLSLAATGLGQPAGTQPALVGRASSVPVQAPAILLLQQQTGLVGTCTGSPFDVNTFISVDANASADVNVTAPGVGQIEEFTDQTGVNIGPYSGAFPQFHIRAFGGGLPPNASITITISTYSGSNLTGSVTNVSSLTFNCTTGEVLSATSNVAVEYYYADWDNYFVTTSPDEIAALDSGAFGGVWTRTGQTFKVWTDASSGARATCRFVTTFYAPKSVHFYTPYRVECAQLQIDPTWQYEGIAFYIALPDSNGVCAAGTVPLYRIYNNAMGGAPNHRYTTSLDTLDQMIAAGWTFEGNGNTKAFACVPS